MKTPTFTPPQTRRVARIFEDVGGYFVCANDLPYLDARGRAYRSRRHAVRWLREQAVYCAMMEPYTHYVTAGGKVRRVPAL